MEGITKAGKNKYLDWAAVGIWILYLFLCFISRKVYDLVIPYASITAFLSLILIFAGRISWLSLLLKKDRELWVLAVALAVTMVNLVLSASGIGAFFTAANLLLLLYLADKTKLKEGLLELMAGACIPLFLFWTTRVMYDYGSNQTGLIILTMYIMVFLFLELQKERFFKQKIFLALLQAGLFLLANQWLIWLRARSAWAGLLIFGFLYLLPAKILRIQWLYRLLVFGATAGAILMVAGYLLMSGLGMDFEMPFMYKNFLSGREMIWFELVSEYLKRSVTGIGSNYRLDVFYMDGMLEVHSGLLDILVVHGTPVFCFVIFFLWKRLFGCYQKMIEGGAAKCGAAGIFAMLFAGFFENYFIVAPFSMVFFFLFIVAHSRNKKVREEGL